MNLWTIIGIFMAAAQLPFFPNTLNITAFFVLVAAMILQFLLLEKDADFND